MRARPRLHCNPIGTRSSELPGPGLTPPVAPTIVTSSISGTPEDGQVLTANVAVTGNPVPTVTYRWQKNGSNISGQTGQTVILNASTMGLVDDDVISCEITATNSQGSVTAEPSVPFNVPAPPASIYDTGDFVNDSGSDAGHAEVIDLDSFRVCRSASLLGRFRINSVPSGNYRIRGTVVAYDGSVGGISGVRLRFLDGFTGRIDRTTTGAFDQTVSVTSGTIRIDAASVGSGGRLDGLIIENA